LKAGILIEQFSNALKSFAAVCTFGAIKYSRGGWQTVPEKEKRYLDALTRHLLDLHGTDEESGLPHMAHAAWNIMALLELQQRDQKDKMNKEKSIR
jgi:hypothetical protein